jgi:hypothetical protein
MEREIQCNLTPNPPDTNIFGLEVALRRLAPEVSKGLHHIQALMFCRTAKAAQAICTRDAP